MPVNGMAAERYFTVTPPGRDRRSFRRVVSQKAMLMLAASHCSLVGSSFPWAQEATGRVSCDALLSFFFHSLCLQGSMPEQIISGSSVKLLQLKFPSGSGACAQAAVLKGQKPGC